MTPTRLHNFERFESSTLLSAYRYDPRATLSSLSSLPSSLHPLTPPTRSKRSQNALPL